MSRVSDEERGLSRRGGKKERKKQLRGGGRGEFNLVDKQLAQEKGTSKVLTIKQEERGVLRNEDVNA